jgi:diguanylate cyclase (GGDEF)-like protein
MFPDRQERSFKNGFDQEWAAILRGDGQLVTANGLFTFLPVNLTLDETKAPQKKQLIFSKENWYIVSAIAKQGPNKALFADNTVDLFIDVLKKNTFEITMMTISSLIMAFLLYLTRSSYNKIKYQSEYDALTKVYNRRAGLARIEQLCPAYSKNCATVISICFVDINGLKQVNDILGHHFGDELIQTSVAVMKSVIREQDFVIRLGGDEFLIVFSNTDEAMAEKIWQRINQEFDKINETENRPYVISLSHGLVCQRNAQKNIVDDLIRIADEKMYSEKQLIKQNLQIIRSTDTKTPPA